MQSNSSHDASEATTARLYRVKAGDNLRSIAEKTYGHAAFWFFLLRANLRELRGGEELRPGQILYLPDLGRAATE
jgi:nucleoid-associated protein YgaU